MSANYICRDNSREYLTRSLIGPRPLIPPRWNIQGIIYTGIRHDNNNELASHYKILSSYPLVKVAVTPENQCLRLSTPHLKLNLPKISTAIDQNIMTINRKDIVAIAVKRTVYIWNLRLNTKEILIEYDNGVRPYTVEFDRQLTSILAISLSNNLIELWDINRKQKIRTLLGHSSLVSAIAWNFDVCTTGTIDGTILYHDTRRGPSYVNTFKYHDEAILALKWSQNLKCLSSAGYDCKVNIWTTESTKPIYTFDKHKSPVKGLAWCPWDENILASGGIEDHTINFYNINYGKLVNSYDTGSEVYSINYMSKFKNLISGHGSENWVLAWEYKHEFIKPKYMYYGHRDRILQMVKTEDECYILTAAADRSIMVWSTISLDTESKVIDDENFNMSLN